MGRPGQVRPSILGSWLVVMTLGCSGEIVRAEASRIYGALRSLGAEELSRLAGRTWARPYGSELPALVLER